MPVDACSSSFAELAAVVMPGYMAQLRKAMTAPHQLADFSTPGVGIRTILKRLGRRSDLAGCYVIMQEGRPMYVGISRGVVSRLRQHCNGTSHFSATLAYSVAKRKLSQSSVGKTHGVTRDAAMKNVAVREAFDAARQLLRNGSVAFIEIANAVELHLFEVYAAIELDTGEWNTFRTH
jgi:predicted GIY-YIG superfamily endonuclease